VVACGSRYGEDKTGQLSVLIEGKTNPDLFQLPDLVAGQTQKSYRIEIRNAGNAPLEIENIVMEADGNPYISINWSAGKPALPRTLADHDDLDYIEFQIIYTPLEPADFNPSVLKVLSTDPDRLEYYMTLEPAQMAPEAQVNPASYTFLNATPGKPETQLFEVTNDGTETLIFYSATLSTPNPEFTVLETPAPGATLNPLAEDPTAILDFKVRYQPIDDQGPDQAVVIVETNDPNQPTVAITVKSKILQGKLVVTYEDMALGYVNFTDLTGLGQQGQKAINLFNEGPGPIRILGGSVEPDDGEGSYALFLQKGEEEASPLDKNTIRSIAAQSSLDLIVQYTVTSETGFDRDISLRYENPYQGTVVLPIAGGAPKPKLIVYPSYAGSESAYLQFHAENDPKTRTLILSNEGTAPLTISDLSIVQPPAFTEQPINFEIVDVPSMPFVIQPLSLQVLSVRFMNEGEAVINHSNLEITYENEIGESSLWNIALRGYKQPEAGILLPTAVPKTSSDSSASVVGTAVQLSGIESLPGDAHIAASGYTWYVISKPVSSAMKLNQSASSTAVFIPDQPGIYQILLFVQTDQIVTGEDSKYGPVDYVNLWSDEAILELEVAPAP